MRPEYYEAILERLQKEFDLTIDRSEHQSITEFREGPIPIFKLIMIRNDEAPEVFSLLVSFQIQMDIPTAIQWFARIRQLDPNTLIGPSYIKDDEGTSYVGEDAEFVYMTMIEQDLIALHMAGERDIEDAVKAGVSSSAPSPARGFSNYKKALSEFRKMKKGRGDTSH